MNRAKKPQARDLQLEAEDHPESGTIEILPETRKGYSGGKGKEEGGRGCSSSHAGEVFHARTRMSSFPPLFWRTTTAAAVDLTHAMDHYTIHDRVFVVLLGRRCLVLVRRRMLLFVPTIFPVLLSLVYKYRVGTLVVCFLFEKVCC